MVEKKNINILPTDKPSRLHLIEDTLTITSDYKNSVCDGEVNIYITSDEEIKEGDWYCSPGGIISKHNGTEILPDNWDKIILTTDQDLINDGIQAIDNEFLEWFIKNPRCEWVEIRKEMYMPQSNGKISDGKITHEISLDPSQNTLPYYKIIIPKEPKQETLEEAAENNSKKGKSIDGIGGRYLGFVDGAKWQAERMYSEEEVRIIIQMAQETILSDLRYEDREPRYSEDGIIEQFKKK